MTLCKRLRLAGGARLPYMGPARRPLCLLASTVCDLAMQRDDRSGTRMIASTHSTTFYLMNCLYYSSTSSNNMPPSRRRGAPGFRKLIMSNSTARRCAPHPRSHLQHSQPRPPGITQVLTIPQHHHRSPCRSPHQLW
ncbi:hypothetical protein L226DRAFT_94147 [Lentinus tigrinus ALCF2SS1-7]|uniref:uncharacterized protein n=1 Tax=Lentinus tigrinus ALCF2SS1-7 TaxID=1328758 RepID=UPI0011661C9E|nr:hypothetical protein L226DRAFT_94147 [Lentinus tigrinus ALCF2SS1-7]